MPVAVFATDGSTEPGSDTPADVATVGGEGYKTLAEAIAAAQPGDTIKLLCDVTEEDAAEGGIVYNIAGITLDLGGYTYSHYNFAHIFEGTGGTVKNGKMVCLSGGSYALFVGDEGETLGFTVDGVELEGGVNIYNATDVLLRNLTVNGTNYYSVWMDEGSSATIEGGTYNAGNVAAFGACSDGDGNPSVLNVSGGTVNTLGKPMLNDAGGSLVISGGVFDAAVDEAYCADGFVPTQNEDGSYGVNQSGGYVAEIGGVKFASLDEAFAAANEGDTIVLLDNITTDAAKTAASDRLLVNTTCTLDLAGYTITVPYELEPTSNWAAFYIMSGTLTVRDSSEAQTGSIVTGDEENVGVYLFNVNGGELVIESGTYFGGGTVAQAQKGTVTVNGGSFDAASFGGSYNYDFMFNCVDTAYKAGTAKVVINGGTFKHFDPRNNRAEGAATNFVAEGVGITVTEDGSFLAQSGMTAQIVDADGNSVAAYATLAEAFDNVSTGDTVILLDDITLTEQINIKKALNGLTLDGNGKTVTCQTTSDPTQSGGSALYFGSPSEKLYCTGIRIKDLTMTGTARYAIFLCGGTSSEFTNVNISGSYYIAVNLYGTHGATMTDCDISNDLTSVDEYSSAIWSNVASANPLVLNNTRISCIAINGYTAANNLAPKIFVNDGSVVDEIHTFDDGSVSGNRKLCVSTESTGVYTVMVYDAENSVWIPIPKYTVTVTSDPTNAGALTGGGVYEEGTAVTVKASVVGGYEFLGWYLGDECVSTDISYTFNVSADADYVAKFKGNEDVKLSVTLGHGKVSAVYGDTSVTWRNDLLLNDFAKGTSFTLTAVPNTGYTFLYWVNAEGRVLSENAKYSFILGNDTSVKACYKETAQAEDTSYVVFRDNITKKIIWAGDVLMTEQTDGVYGTVSAPTLLNYAGQTFVGWFDADGNELVPDSNGKLHVTADMTVYAKYQAKADTYTVTVNGEVSGEYRYGTSVSVSAEEMKDGMYFSGWYCDGTLVSTSATYSFIIKGDTNLTTEYTDAEPVPTPVSRMTMGDRVKLDNGKQTVEMNLSWSLPEGYKLLKAGIIRTYGDAYKDSLTLENVDGTNIKLKESVLTSAEGNYAFTLTMSTATAVNDLYAVGFIMYQNASGTITTQYTEVFASPAGN